MLPLSLPAYTMSPTTAGEATTRSPALNVHSECEGDADGPAVE